MGPPRRNLFHSPPTNRIPSSSPETPQSPLAHRPPAPVKQSNMGMSPASRYQHNLKVLRRRDPSIVSIFDQFSHVCLYHHNGTKWEKQGYEGSMFLYERNSYPPYGFYILNRMGMDDHIQRLYPEDNIGAHGSYLIIRSYPEFTHRRLAAARASQPNETSHKFSDIYAIHNVDHLTTAQKGESQTIGLWMFTNDSREPLIDIFSRLHSFIKKNQPYPQEFRYGPDRPPPPTVGNISYTNGTAQTQSFTYGSSSQSNGDSMRPISPQPHSNGDASDIDKLFAKIETIPASHRTPTPSSSQLPESTSKMTVESLFSALGAQDPINRQASANISPSPASPTASVTGISLLDSIFASVTTPLPSTNQVASQDITATVLPSTFLPIPASHSSPQVLNQNVISTLLGFPPPRASSVASTAYSAGAQSHPSSREGDSEGDSDQHRESDGFSELGTVLNPNAAEFHSNSRRSIQHNSFTNGHLHVNGEGILGNVTPKARTQTSITLSPPPLRHTQSPKATDVLSSSSHIIRQPPFISGSPSLPPKPAPEISPSPASQSGYTTHPRAPFETCSELWPHPRGSSQGVGGEIESDEILELDFADTSALSDPDSFQKALNGRKRYGTDQEVRELNGVEGGIEKSHKKKEKKERIVEQPRLRQEVENGRDVPTPSSTIQPTEQSLPPSVSPSPVPVSKPRQPRGATRESPQQLKTKLNGTGMSFAQSTPTVPDVVKDSLISAFTSQNKVQAAPTLERNDFIREVLTLIHTDKVFVDTLYREYTNRVR